MQNYSEAQEEGLPKEVSMLQVYSLHENEKLAGCAYEGTLEMTKDAWVFLWSSPIVGSRLIATFYYGAEAGETVFHFSLFSEIGALFQPVYQSLKPYLETIEIDRSPWLVEVISRHQLEQFLTENSGVQADVVEEEPPEPEDPMASKDPWETDAPQLTSYLPA